MTTSGAYHPVVGQTLVNDTHVVSTGGDVEANAPVSMAKLESEKGNAVDTFANPEAPKALPNELPDYDAQRGIQKIEATTLAWGRWSLVALLVKCVESSTKKCRCGQTYLTISQHLDHLPDQRIARFHSRRAGALRDKRLQIALSADGDRDRLQRHDSRGVYSHGEAAGCVGEG
jgi:hypothetical protein